MTRIYENQGGILIQEASVQRSYMLQESED